jgi:pimeloyl-ACP methyl ester carboxylesterase
MDVFADNIICYFDENNLRTIQIYGYSMGVYAAVHTALKFPQRISKIMTLASVFDWSPERSHNESAMLDPEKIQLKVPAFAENLKQQHGVENWKSLMVKTVAIMRALGEKHLIQSDFAAIACPVRIAAGDRGKMVSVESSLTVSKSIAQTSFLVIPETPHPFEQADLSRLAFGIVQYIM